MGWIDTNGWSVKQKVVNVIDVKNKNVSGAISGQYQNKRGHAFKGAAKVHVGGGDF